MRKRQSALLKSESRDEYNEFQEVILSAVNCQSPIERLLAQDVIDESWNIARLRNARAQITKKGFAPKERLSERAEDRVHKREYDEDLKAQAEVELQDESTREEGLKKLLEPIEVSICNDGKDLGEIEDAIALEQGIESQIKFDQLIDASYKRRNDALRQLDWCRKEFANNLRGASDAAIAAATGDHDQGEEEEVEPLASIVPDCE